MTKKKIGVSSTPPANEARPLGTKKPAASKKATSATSVQNSAEKPIDSVAPPSVDSSSTQTTSATEQSSPSAGNTAPTSEEPKVMATITLSLDPKSRKSTSVVFKLPAGLRGSVRIAKTAFTNGTPPTSLNLQSDSETAFAGPKPTLTAEQRKALRKNAPKLTAAQKLAKLQERAAKLQAKIEADAKAAAAPAEAAPAEAAPAS